MKLPAFPGPESHAGTGPRAAATGQDPAARGPECASPPAWQGLDEIKPARRGSIHPESALQKGVKRAASRVVACQHEFVCHDRGAEHSDKSHIFEAQRGYRRAWPDTELLCESGLTANIELKKPGWKAPREGTAAWPHYRDQRNMLARLATLGRVTGFASSVMQCCAIWAEGGVPLSPNWRTVAAHEDELVAADIRGQEARRDGGGKKPKRVRARPRASVLKAVARAWGKGVFL